MSECGSIEDTASTNSRTAKHTNAHRHKRHRSHAPGRQGSHKSTRRRRRPSSPTYDDAISLNREDREIEDGLSGLVNAYNEGDDNGTVAPNAGAPDGITASPTPPATVVAVPLFDTNWGEVSPADKFCFLCEYDEEGTKALSNQWYTGLKNLVDKEDIPIYSRCQHILHYYERNLRPYSVDEKEWTLRGIRAHLVHHGGLSTKATIDDLKVTQYALIKKVVDSGVVMRKTDGTEQINTKGMMTVNRMMHTYMLLARSGTK
jgi:hypothetical protein